MLITKIGFLSGILFFISLIMVCLFVGAKGKEEAKKSLTCKFFATIGLLTPFITIGCLIATIVISISRAI